MLRARRVDAERAEHDVLAEVDAVDKHGPDVEGAERPRHPLRELLRREGDESTTDRALARAARLDPRARRLDRACVLPRGNADRHLLERAEVKRVAARELGPRVERHLVSGSIDDARTTERGAAAAEGELAARRPGPRRLPRAVVLVSLPAQPRALGFEHRGDGLHPELVHEREKVAAHQRSQWHQQLRPQRGLFPSDSLEGFFMAVPFWESTPRCPRGRVEPPPSNFSSYRDDAAVHRRLHRDCGFRKL